ncbi:ScyD/ScyE family protein, partial [Nostoc sp. CHAB 5715]|uniref:ScyD/ScyE family protein n=1 Tax=Nostoc sp. CHAB 5715 TaxID=2780400 RepID=UPI001E2EFFC4
LFFMKKIFIISGILFTFFFSSGFGIGENNNVAKKEISQRQTLRQTQTAESQAFISEKLNEAAQSEEKAINQKSIYRINSNNNKPEVYLDGFTNISDLAFDPKGNLYVLEFAANSISSSSEIPIGTLTRVALDGTRTVITNKLITPTALSLASDGAIYVTNNGFQAGEGQILRIVPKNDSTSIPEPASTFSLLVFGAYGMLSLLQHKQKSIK